MDHLFPHAREIDMIGNLAELKEQHYQHAVLLGSLLELLLERGWITVEELRAKAAELEAEDTPPESAPTRPPRNPIP
ncbi:hypothetical protein ACFQWB_14440 [Paenibacillus thermoaerophilus]|jgi:hypothetical protein|uniref:Nitrile hydratase subunit beta n=1 Tax=Paenibacillus thermoaerophilus TaxID=1215385 RepID=A0ABW2V6B7_9BACL|nr:hypothetical protein [Paenibacillus thermoaerophilus]TMV06611.1 hypothetical protein FE781_16685 [Paenibacillus thermoaerophilus]